MNKQIANPLFWGSIFFLMLSCNDSTSDITVTFNPDNGNEELVQIIVPGGTAKRPDDPFKDFTVPGLYAGSQYGYVFTGWFNGNEEFDFTTPITEPVTLKAGWSGDSNPLADVPGNNIDAAIAHINTHPGSYTLLINDELGAGSQTIDSASQLIIRGLHLEQAITYNGPNDSRLFHINHAQAGIILGANITLSGITTSSGNLVYVQAGNLTMRYGSKIIKHRTSNAQGAVYISGQDSSFTMEGGYIRENVSTSNASIASGGITIGGGAVFTMSGGDITGNKSRYTGQLAAPDWPADVIIDHDSSFRLGGNAAIEALLLNADSANASVTITGPYTGQVDSFNLRRNSSSIDNVISTWENSAVITAAEGYTLEASDIAAFFSRNFLTSGTGALSRQPIAGNASGSNFHLTLFENQGKLIRIE